MCATDIEDLEPLECPDCPNQGWYTVGSVYSPEQEQCAFCYCEPASKFNVTRGLQTNIKDITNFYIEYEKDPTRQTFSLVEQCHNIGNIVSKLNKYPDYLSDPTLNEDILKLEKIIQCFAQNIEIFDRKLLVEIIPLSYMAAIINENIYAPYVVSLELNTLRTKSIIENIDIIIEHLYGPNKENIKTLATSFGMETDVNYWKSCLTDPLSINNNTYDLPLL